VILGLTGSIGSGKSTVTQAFKALGATIICADDLAREVVLPGTAAYSEIAAHFGPDIAPPGGPLDRPGLARRVFAHPHERQLLESFIHPRVRERELELLRQHRDDALVVLDIPLLFETGAQEICDRTVVVTCDDAIRKERLRRGRGMTPEQVDARLAAQMPEHQKLRLADHQIDNSGELSHTLEQARQLFEQLTARPA
jgi:dephospho-CoA kinase